MGSKGHLLYKTLSTVILLMALLVCNSVWAWPPTFGAEYELSNDEIRSDFFMNAGSASTSKEKKAQLRFVEHLRKRCLTHKCKVVGVRGKFDEDYLVEYEDGWWFKVSYDPGCVEITFKPTELEALQKKASFINGEIFKAGEEIGLTVATRGHSHVNIGIRSAFNDANEFLRFFVDYANHPDLALGGLGQDNNNAPSLSILKSYQREALQEIVSRANRGFYNSIGDVAADIQAKVYTESYNKSWGGVTHYQAVGLKYVNRTNLGIQDAPFELRAMRIQESQEKFNLIAKLIQSRIEYLRQFKTPIVYNQSDRTSFDDEELRTRFEIYIRETGLPFREFKSLLSKGLQEIRPAKFINKTIAPIERLKSFRNGYEDLLVVSPFVRSQVIDILTQPGVLTSQIGRDFYLDLQSHVDAKNQVVRPTLDKTKIIYQDLIKQISERVTEQKLDLSCKQVLLSF